MIRIIEDRDVQALIDRDDALDVIERTYRAAASGQARRGDGVLYDHVDID